MSEKEQAKEIGELLNVTHVVIRGRTYETGKGTKRQRNGKSAKDYKHEKTRTKK